MDELKILVSYKQLIVPGLVDEVLNNTHICLGFKHIVAEKIFLSDGPAGFEPIQRHGDGNCLYRAMSRILCGNEDMHVELRV